ncbi:hypothetical protein C2845_PM09G11610 [Panicum miliaceum]|uniref:Trichome birefringence-like C-terminal domain-containing protein n=1 Tax=Panicum miliaceum TaxID=4540 RepID=A0A3L6S067_PANMI|nr:hypothetical protein C2845_PM09G11610 [Panicum miliaceum]
MTFVLSQVPAASRKFRTIDGERERRVRFAAGGVPEDISKTADPEFRTMRCESHNFTVAIFLSPFLVGGYQPDPTRHMWAIHLDEPDAAWVPGITGFDRVILSAANWFACPAMFYEAGRVVGCHYCLAPDVPDLTHRHSLRMAFRAALRALTGPGAGRGTAAATAGGRGRGRWMTGQDLDFHTAQVEEFARAKVAVVEAGGRGPRLVLMDTTPATVLRPDGHPSRYGHWAHENVTLYNDCVHWCLPGPIDAWNEMLLQMLLRDPS